MSSQSDTEDSQAGIVASLARAIDSVFPGVAMTIRHRLELGDRASEAAVEIPARPARTQVNLSTPSGCVVDVIFRRDPAAPDQTPKGAV